LDESAIEQMIADRAAAKKAKNFAESDRIRDELKAGSSRWMTATRNDLAAGLIANASKTALNGPFFWRPSRFT
jgi:hypothetical protein